MARKYLFPAVIVLWMTFALPAFAPSVRADQNNPEGTAGVAETAKPAPDPLVGNWQCTNGVYNYAFFFRADGTLIQQEPTFGNTRNSSWTRLSEQEITLAGGTRLSVDMDGDDHMSVLDTRVGATWDCSRQ